MANKFTQARAWRHSNYLGFWLQRKDINSANLTTVALILIKRKGQVDHYEEVQYYNRKQHLLCLLSNSKINQEDPGDSGGNLSDLAFQTVRFSWRFPSLSYYLMGSHLKVTHPLLFSYISLSSFLFFYFFCRASPLGISQAQSWVWLQRHSSMFWLLMIAILTESWLRGSSKPLLIMVISYFCSWERQRDVMRKKVCCFIGFWLFFLSGYVSFPQLLLWILVARL